ncbi:alpha/beta hydrolase [Yinghuangia sp. YIM S10712]|uniref:alpha/beta hydrolase n=1 Tax=Yinghuangia sp. YIM S10712 TaxID=3436930 RepID=UPI003F53A992
MRHNVGPAQSAKTAASAEQQAERHVGRGVDHEVGREAGEPPGSADPVWGPVSAPALPSVEPVCHDVAGVPISGLLARPVRSPGRGTILALHGGGSRAAYWHRDSAADTSLLLLGASLGWSVLAIDRPGYGASAGLAREVQDLDHQADLVFRLIAMLPGLLGDDFGPGVFLAGHSMGGILALRMGGREEGLGLFGAAVGGVPLRYTPGKAQAMAGVSEDVEHAPPLRGPSTAFETYFGPVGSYDPALRTREGRILARIPIAEFIDARDAPLTLPGTMGKVRVPVHWTAAEFEASNAAGPETLPEVGQLLAQAPRVELHTHPGVGHNISLHHAARAYHLRVIAFAEECRSDAVLPV